MAVTRGQFHRVGEDNGDGRGPLDEAPAGPPSPSQQLPEFRARESDEAKQPQPSASEPKEEERSTYKVALVVVGCVLGILAGILSVIWLTKASDEASDPGYDPRSTWWSRKLCGAASRVGDATSAPSVLSRPFVWLLEPAQVRLEQACKAVTPKEGAYPPWRPDVEQWQQESLTFFLSTSFVLGAVAIPVARNLFDIRLGQRVLAQVMGFVPEPSDITVVKWREACWKLLTYAGLSIYGVFVLAGEDFVLDTGNLWQGWPRQNHSRSLLMWYCLEFGLYGYGLVDIIVWEAVRSDYFSMIIHHISTLSLLFGSFYFGFLRIGALIMIMNDFVDVWFEGAKLANYAHKKETSTFFYVSFVVTWFFLRQLYCPWVLQWTCCFQAWELVERFGPSTFNVSTWVAFNSLLMVLEIQHTYWFVFILQKVQLKVSIKVIGRYDTDLTED